MDTRTLLRERLRRARDWAAAIDELEKELEGSVAKPDQSERLFELARLTEDVIPERERALGLYQRAWKLHPDNLKALSRAREVYGELGRHEMVAKLGEMELKSPSASAELAGIVGEALLDSGTGHFGHTPFGHIGEAGCNAALDAQGGQLFPIGHRNCDGDRAVFLGEQDGFALRRVNEATEFLAGEGGGHGFHNSLLNLDSG